MEVIAISKIHRTVVRNQPYQKSGIGIRERHNERKNMAYTNPDIDLSRAPLNVHFKRCETSYLQMLEQMVGSGKISTRGLKEDAKTFGELVFDVNTSYFEENGGYEYAKQFFAEAYRFAECEAGAEYILSAVMHADERNRSLSDELGRDVYHYHLHVVYIPVVDKEIKWSKRCKDKALVGKTKEIIHQVSHSKKWAFQPAIDENGRTVYGKDGKQKRISSYSLLQDRFHTHMKEAGYEGFERGERGSTAEHLSVIDYKVQQDMQRLGAIEKKIGSRKNTLTALDNMLESAEKTHIEYQQIDGMGKKKLGGKIEFTPQEYADISALAKEGALSRRKIYTLERELHSATSKLSLLQMDYENLYKKTLLFVEAMRVAPQKITGFLKDILIKAREEQQQKRQSHQQQRERPQDNRGR